MSHRPAFTGDVFQGLSVQAIPNSRTRTVILVQHPCALRVDGVRLAERLIVAEVTPFRLLDLHEWRGNFGRMPLPDLMPGTAGKKRHQAAGFDNPYLVARDEVDLTKRIACLSQEGVDLLLQRWVCHNSRVVVPTFQYLEVCRAQFEEADLIEEWVEARHIGGGDPQAEAVEWLRGCAEGNGATRQERLGDPQQVSAVRQEMRKYLQ